MSENKSKRRAILKSIAAGSGAIVAGKSLPEAWKKPVIDSVVLPAHAVTTDDTGSAPGAPTTPSPCCLTDGIYCGESGEQSINVINFQVTIAVSADGTVQGRVSDGCNTWSGTTTIPCTGGSFSIDATDFYPCGGGGAALEGGSGGILNAPLSFQIEGTVNCGVNSISGTITYDTDNSYAYTANPCIK